MARDVETLRAAGGAVLRFSRAPFTLRRWLVAADAFELAEPAAARAIYEVRGALLPSLQSPMGMRAWSFIVCSFCRGTARAAETRHLLITGALTAFDGDTSVSKCSGKLKLCCGADVGP